MYKASVSYIVSDYTESVFFRWNDDVLYTVTQKNDTDIAHYNVNANQAILVIFGRDIAERICH